jgi:deoxyribonuclease V
MIRPHHPWDISCRDAVQIQSKLAGNLVFDWSCKSIRTVGGVDISYSKTSRMMYAGVLVFDFETMELIDEGLSAQEETFPYIPGLLTFREGPVAEQAWDRLRVKPDVLIFDGHGIAHPRSFGTATHLGLLWGIPSIGCAKKRLVGEYREPGNRRGSVSDLMLAGKCIGSVVRTRFNVKPVFVSSGYRVVRECAVKIILACGRGYRLPEPTRQAHKRVNTFRLAEEG